MTYEFIQVQTEADKVGVITLNRPKQLNALNDQLMNELGEALAAFDADERIGCMVITGSEKAFAAGADIGAMATYSFTDVYKHDYITRNWERIRQIRKPVIAAVSGFALGGGCEILLHSDAIQAHAETYPGLVEVGVGVIPGWGGCKEMLLRLKFQKPIEWHANKDGTSVSPTLQPKPMRLHPIHRVPSMFG